MKILSAQEASNINGGLVFLAALPTAAKAALAVAGAISAAYGVYSSGKGIGSDIVAGMRG